MAIKIGNGKRSSSSSTPLQSQVRRATQKLVNGADVGKFRKYLKPGKGREWDEDSPYTPEGRLTKWNLEDWFAPSRDEKGHEERLTIGFPPAVIEELSMYAVNIPELRNSIKQAVRVAVLEFIRTLKFIQPNKKSDMSRIDAAVKLNHAAEVLAGYEDTFAAGRQNVHLLLLTGMKNEARKLAHNLVTIAKGIPSKEGRVKYQRSIEREFKKLLADGKSVKANVYRNRILKRARRRQREESGWEQDD